MNSVKSNLKRLRIARGLTQDGLAEKLHVVRQTVSSWETGKTTPDVESLTSIAEALEVDIKELIYGPMAKDNFVLKRTKRVQRAVFIGVVAILLWGLGIFWADLLSAVGVSDTFYADFNMYSLQHLLHTLGGCIFPAMAYSLCGVVFILVIEAWREFTWLTIKIRCGAFVFGLSFMLFYLAIVVFALTGVWHIPLLFKIFYFIYPRKYLLFVSGILIGCRMDFVVEGRERREKYAYKKEL